MSTRAAPPGPPPPMVAPRVRRTSDSTAHRADSSPTPSELLSARERGTSSEQPLAADSSAAAGPGRPSASTGYSLNEADNSQLLYADIVCWVTSTPGGVKVLHFCDVDSPLEFIRQAVREAGLAFEPRANPGGVRLRHAEDGTGRRPGDPGSEKAVRAEVFGDLVAALKDPARAIGTNAVTLRAPRGVVPGPPSLATSIAECLEPSPDQLRIKQLTAALAAEERRRLEADDNCRRLERRTAAAEASAARDAAELRRARAEAASLLARESQFETILAGATRQAEAHAARAAALGDELTSTRGELVDARAESAAAAAEVQRLLSLGDVARGQALEARAEGLATALETAQQATDFKSSLLLQLHRQAAHDNVQHTAGLDWDFDAERVTLRLGEDGTVEPAPKSALGSPTPGSGGKVGAAKARAAAQAAAEAKMNAITASEANALRGIIERRFNGGLTTLTAVATTLAGYTIRLAGASRTTRQAQVNDFVEAAAALEAAGLRAAGENVRGDVLRAGYGHGLEA